MAGQRRREESSAPREDIKEVSREADSQAGLPVPRSGTGKLMEATLAALSYTVPSPFLPPAPPSSPPPPSPPLPPLPLPPSSLPPFLRFSPRARAYNPSRPPRPRTGHGGVLQ